MNNNYKEILPFLEENKHLIDRNRFKELYDKAEINEILIPILTDLLLQADIDPFVDKSLIKIPKYFASELDITSFKIPGHIKFIDSYAFLRCRIKNIIFSDGNLEIFSYAFQNCTHLEEVILPDSITVINNHAFRNCTRLKKVKLSNSIDIIAEGTFQHCSNLESIDFSKYIIHIDSKAFADCKKLKEITINNSNTTIYPNAFSGCNNIESIIFNGTRAQWTSFDHSFKFNSHKTITIQCIDGEIKV